MLPEIKSNNRLNIPNDKFEEKINESGNMKELPMIDNNIKN